MQPFLTNSSSNSLLVHTLQYSHCSRQKLSIYLKNNMYSMKEYIIQEFKTSKNCNGKDVKEKLQTL